MLFNSTLFLFAFLPLVLVGWRLISLRSVSFANLLLLVSSVFFYAWWDIKALPILLMSVAFNFAAGHLIRKHDKSKLMLVLSITVNLAALGYYKYVDFAIEVFSQATGYAAQSMQVELPIGISFFTFTQIAYLIDVYRNKASEPNIVNYGLFVTYFPHLIAGPILHHKEMMTQFLLNRWRSSNLAIGGAILSIGLFKKVYLADSVSLFASPIFSKFDEGIVVSSFEAWIAALSYTLQIYLDFSAYCDMAIGISFMFGILLPINFYSPYKATNVIDFWRRWHMTLSRFLRDYLYISLGGNRFGTLVKYRNIMITMILGGLWHGAAWNFIIWGALHSCYLLINHAFREAGGSVPKFVSWLITFLAVILAWVFFRANSLNGAVSMIGSMFGVGAEMFPETYEYFNPMNAVAWVVSMLAFVLVAPNIYEVFSHYRIALIPNDFQLKADATSDGITRWAMSGVAGFIYGFAFAWSVFLITRAFGHSEFLYFRF